MRALVAALTTVALMGSAHATAPPAADPIPADPYHFLDMEHHKPNVPPGVTPASERVSPAKDSGGAALVYEAGSSVVRKATDGRALMHRVGFQAGEPTIGVNKRGTLFYQALDGPPVVLRSTDGGRKWRDVSPKLGERKRHPNTLDPFLWTDYQTGRVFTYDFLFGCSQLSFTDDSGKNWTTTPLNCGLQDHQNLFAGRPSLSVPIDYENVVYSCSTQGGATIYSVAAQCLKSLDGGISWVPTGAPAFVTEPQPENDLGIDGYCHGAIGHGIVGPDGSVYIPKGFCGEPWIAISRDEGATWKRVQIAKNGVPQTSIGVYEHETSVAVDSKGNLFYFWMSGDRQPYLAVSRDKGNHWSKPIPVGPPNLKEASLPHLTAGGKGKVAIVYYGSTNSPGKPFPQKDDCKGQMVECFSNLFFLNPPDPKRYEDVTWNGYMTVSANALAKRPTFRTITVNKTGDPFVRGTCGPIRCKAVYDFIDVTIDRRGRPWGAYVDICLSACAEGTAGNQGNEGVVGTMLRGPNLR